MCPVDSVPAPPLLRPAHIADIAYVMATERLPGYDRLVACWSEEEHVRSLALPGVAYLVFEAPRGVPAGFAILEGLDDVHHGVKLKRIALENPGRGLGAAFLAQLADWVFTRTDAARLWLDVFTDNERAVRAYLRAGYRNDGLLRQAYVRPSGERVDRYLMSILRQEWRGP